MDDRLNNICEAVEKSLLLSELTEDRFLRSSNKGGNEIYIFTAHEAPNLMKEVGRVRELAFRAAGGGTGKECDIDEFDIRENNPCKQLIVWDPEEQEIIGGYRYLRCDEMPVGVNGVPEMAMTEIFDMSARFIEEYIPYTIELGRSFVHPKYQSTQMKRKSLYALDNLWDGLGALTVDNPDIKFLMGKVTMYRSYNVSARDMLLTFLRCYFEDKESLVTPKEKYAIYPDSSSMELQFTGENYAEEYRALSKSIRTLGENIPPLVNAYMGLSPTMKLFGTSLNPFFGGVEESGILITIEDVYDEKKDRHISSYNPENKTINLKQILNTTDNSYG
ncbi:MAG: GNAT family N-acetyltransferase [Marinifilaceae bacterium]|nr:GNAT family N-acetyltransferase [Marinifilaceae bacterium]